MLPEPERVLRPRSEQAETVRRDVDELVVFVLQHRDERRDTFLAVGVDLHESPYINPGHIPSRASPISAGNAARAFGPSVARALMTQQIGDFLIRMIQGFGQNRDCLDSSGVDTHQRNRRIDSNGAPLIRQGAAQRGNRLACIRSKARQFPGNAGTVTVAGAYRRASRPAESRSWSRPSRHQARSGPGQPRLPCRSPSSHLFRVGAMALASGPIWPRAMTAWRL